MTDPIVRLRIVEEVSIYRDGRTTTLFLVQGQNEDAQWSLLNVCATLEVAQEAILVRVPRSDCGEA